MPISEVNNSYTFSMFGSKIEYFSPGIMIIPELDQPSHVGNGWNYPGGEDNIICMNREPWFEWCVQPPCGIVSLAVL